MRIFYGKGAYRRQTGNLPELKVINMFVEPSPVDEEGAILQSRKGVTDVADTEEDSVAGVFSEAGVFDGDVFTVSGEGPVSFAASADELGICVDGQIWRYDGTGDATQVTLPDDFYAIKILYHDGLFFALRADTGDWYASGVLDLATWSALSFKSAESQPDNLLDAEFLSDAIYLFGQATIEPWDNDETAATVPYTRRELSIMEIGIKATGCVTKTDQGLWFVSNDNRVMVTRGQAPERVSDHAMEERIAASSNVSTFGYIHEGHTFVCVRLDSGTWAVDISTKEWCEAQTLGLPNWIVSCATKPGDIPVFGGSDGKVYGFSDGWVDGDYPLERRFTAGVPLSGGTLSVDVVSIQANIGFTGKYTGQGSEPLVEMRTSRDGGATWGQFRAVSLGERGDYRTRSRWRRVGMFDEPGALFEFRTTEPVGFRVSGVFVNEQGGGRSR
jgi:hypothetical protein